MRLYAPISSSAQLPDVVNWLRGISIQRTDDVKEINNLNTQYVQGRLRTDRAAPSSHSDVTATDQLGDIVRTGSFEYIVVNDAGTLKWSRVALNVAW